MSLTLAPATKRMFASKQGQALLARLDAATDEAFPDRDAHIRQVALTVMRAKGQL